MRSDEARRISMKADADEDADRQLRIAVARIIMVVVFALCWWLLGQARTRELNRRFTLFLTGKEQSNGSFPLSPSVLSSTPVA